MSLIFISFDSIQIFRGINSLSFQVSWGLQFLTEVKHFLDFGIFRLGLSNFWIGSLFPFDVFQLTQQSALPGYDIYGYNADKAEELPFLIFILVKKNFFEKFTKFSW